MGKSEDFWAKLGHTTQGLTTLEINTIIKSNMNGNKVSDNNRNALYQLAGIYAVELDNLGDKYKKLLPEDHPLKQYPKNIFRRHRNFMGGGVFSFREIGICAEEAAHWLLSNNQDLGIDEKDCTNDHSMLKRIESKCFEMSNMLQLHIVNDKNIKPDPLKFNQDLSKFMQDNNLNDYLEAKLKRLKERYDEWIEEIDPEEDKYGERSKEDFLKYNEDIELSFKNRLQLVKAYDIGLEQIMLQTRIEMDGDITTRISGNFAENPNQLVMDMHKLSIDISVSFWNKIFDVVTSFFTKILDRFKIG